MRRCISYQLRYRESRLKFYFDTWNIYVLEFLMSQLTQFHAVAIHNDWFSFSSQIIGNADWMWCGFFCSVTDFVFRNWSLAERFRSVICVKIIRRNAREIILRCTVSSYCVSKTSSIAACKTNMYDLVWFVSFTSVSRAWFLVEFEKHEIETITWLEIVSVKSKFGNSRAERYLGKIFFNRRIAQFPSAVAIVESSISNWEELQQQQHRVNVVTTADAFMNYTSVDRSRMVSHIVPVSGVSWKPIRIYLQYIFVQRNFVRTRIERTYWL